MTERFFRQTLLTLACVALCALTASAQPPAVTGAHAEELVCADCHTTGPNGEAPSADESATIADCSECHDPAENIHPVGIEPKVDIPEGFALSADGAIMCRTCHKLHGGNPNAYFLNDAENGYADGRATFCANCHGSENVRTNPHSAKRGDKRCTFCHTEVTADAEASTNTVRMGVVRLCNFCHGAAEKNHPRNIDPTLSIPPGLPLDSDGNWSCVTCHDPHGTISTTHYIRPIFAQSLEKEKGENPHTDDYFTCKGCHLESNEEGTRIPGDSLRFRGDITVLCISCHITDRGHHPTGIALPDVMQERYLKEGRVLTFDENNRINCYTCHDNQCSTETFKMNVRYYNAKQYDTTLCWSCHDKDSYTTSNPHTQNPKTCTLCHEGRPTRGVSSSLSAVPLMVCLHCHEVKPHPMGKPHIGKPSEIIQVDPSLPLSKTGEVSCITCHDPHYDPEGRPHRLRVPEPASICNMCHWK